ncbi:hypothetical protein UFOVP366_30 [uncultured Caudovirales phage]|uniref:Uncharacterized protein n=1 Tax=uncultured Caudovirales phage TaxID=2100421 RepID=A0A6J7X3J5_9CAUD|nr:hypothetical protein UFOVP366_30 [uncultured Caudovirales phage]
MANEATAEYYTKQNKYDKAKFKTDYDQYLEDLATKYGISQEQLNSNLEARGILRSGEAGTAQARLGAANEAAITTAGTNYQYNVDTADTNLLKQLAGLQSATPAPATTTPVTTTPPTTTPPTTTPPTIKPAPTTPPTIKPAPTTPQQYDFSKIDFAGLGKWAAQIEKDKKAQAAAAPGYNWKKVGGWGS